MTRRASRGEAPADVEGFLASLEHPRKRELVALREIILGADPRVSEEVKWNAPSFRTTEHFATFQLRAKEGVQVILHAGAKRRADGPARGAVDDPASLLEWLADDRASVRFRDLAEIEARRAAFTDLLRRWIARV